MGHLARTHVWFALHIHIKEILVSCFLEGSLNRSLVLILLLWTINSARKIICYSVTIVNQCKFINTFEYVLHFQKTWCRWRLSQLNVLHSSVVNSLVYTMWTGITVLFLVIFKGYTSVRGYFPDATWYDGLDGSILRISGGGGQYHTLSAPWDKINFHFRGGHIILTQEPNITTFFR